MGKDYSKQYIFIAQSTSVTSECRIGLSNNLDKHLSAYNDKKRKSADNEYRYVFVCEVNDMAEIMNDIREQFHLYRIPSDEEIYFLNELLFEMYADFIKSHPLFEEVLFVVKRIY